MFLLIYHIIDDNWNNLGQLGVRRRIGRLNVNGHKLNVNYSQILF